MLAVSVPLTLLSLFCPIAFGGVVYYSRFEVPYAHIKKDVQEICRVGYTCEEIVRPYSQRLSTYGIIADQGTSSVSFNPSGELFYPLIVYNMASLLENDEDEAGLERAYRQLLDDKDESDIECYNILKSDDKEVVKGLESAVHRFDRILVRLALLPNYPFTLNSDYFIEEAFIFTNQCYRSHQNAVLYLSNVSFGTSAVHVVTNRWERNLRSWKVQSCLSSILNEARMWAHYVEQIQKYLTGVRQYLLRLWRISLEYQRLREQCPEWYDGMQAEILVAHRNPTISVNHEDRLIQYTMRMRHVDHLFKSELSPERLAQFYKHWRDSIVFPFEHASAAVTQTMERIIFNVKFSEEGQPRNVPVESFISFREDVSRLQREWEILCHIFEGLRDE